MAVIVGADRVAANGDVANKIGTYSVAVPGPAPRHPVLRRPPAFHDRPAVASGADIPIEERDAKEVTGYGELRWRPVSASPRATLRST